MSEKSDSSTDPPSSKLRILRNAIGKQVVLRSITKRFARPDVVGDAPAVLVEINVEDSTVVVQDAAGNLHRVRRWCWATRKESGMFWCWPDAGEPEDPDDFKPTHFPNKPKPPQRAA